MPSSDSHSRRPFRDHGQVKNAGVDDPVAHGGLLASAGAAGSGRGVHAGTDQQPTLDDTSPARSSLAQREVRPRRWWPAR